jgi:hypothetical protein
VFALTGDRVNSANQIQEDRFAADSLLEGTGFEPSVPRIATMVFVRSLRTLSGEAHGPKPSRSAAESALRCGRLLTDVAATAEVMAKTLGESNLISLLTRSRPGMLERAA